jgi:putative flippase GtrA
VFTVAHLAGVHYLPAAVLGFLVAVTHNFLWNRHWTFAAGGGAKRRQSPRFLAVSLLGFAVQAGLLTLLVEAGGLAEPLAQAISIALAMPVNFGLNRIWTFRGH